MSKLIKHIACPDCGSSDALAVYEDHEHCYAFGCDRHVFYNENGERKITEDVEKVERPMFPLPSKDMPGLDARSIRASTINKYKVSVSRKEDSLIEAVMPLFDDEGQHVANQVRLKEKQFRVEGSLSNAGLFGQSLFPSGGRSITVTEGYYDAMSAFQLTGDRYPNVGVMSASSAKKEVVKSFEYLNSFDTIVLNFDNDDPGQKAAKDVAQLFEPGKIKILKLENAKDANDYLMQGMNKEYVNEWFRSPIFMPDGLRLGSELWEDIKNHKDPESVPYPWEGLNQKTYGIRLSEFVLLTADTGIGKTSICKAIEYSLLTNPQLVKDNVGVGFLHLEEEKYDTAIGLMSIHIKKPLHLPDTIRTEEEMRKAYDEVINSNRIVLYDHFGSNDIDIVLAKIRHMAALGCKYVVLDHLSILTSEHSGDERKQLDEISTKLKTMTMNLRIAIIAVIHINRQGLIRGSAGPEQVANMVIRLERDKKESSDWRRNITRLSVEKNRFCGRTGPACHLHYDGETGTLNELSKELADEYEQGGVSSAGHEFAAYGGQEP